MSRPILTPPASGLQEDASWQKEKGSWLAKAYGSTVPRKIAGAPQERLDMITVLVNLFMPTVIFDLVTYCQGSHYSTISPLVCQLIVIACGVIAVLLNIGWVAHLLKEGWRSKPYWKVLLGVTTMIAFIMAMTIGQISYVDNVRPYVDLHQLSTQSNIDPLADTSMEIMDAGIVKFKTSSIVNTSMGIGFKNRDVYCVAPIGTAVPSQKYAFWAVGLNCCPSGPGTFNCGDVKVPNATTGIRLITQEQAQFYALAVQEAEATYNLQASQPSFFYWVQDGESTINEYLTNGLGIMLLSMLCHFAGQLTVVFVAVFVYTKPQAFSAV